MDLSTRCKIVVAAPVNAYEKEYVRNLAQRALISSSISPGTGPAIVVIGNSRIMGTSLSVESSDFFEQLKILPTVQIDADSTITVIEERVRAALNDFSAPVMVRELSLLPLLIVCPPFETGNERHDIPTVDVLCGPEEIKLAWVPSDNFEFTVMDIRQALSPRLLRRTSNLMALGRPYYPKDAFSIHSGASHHFTGNKLLFDPESIIDVYDTLNVGNAEDGYTMDIVAQGTISRPSLTLPDVRYVPGLKVNAVSVSLLAAMDYDVHFSGNRCVVKEKLGGEVVGEATQQKDGLKLYMVDYLRIPLSRSCLPNYEAVEAALRF